MNETQILQSIRAELSHGTIRLYRNNSGRFQDRTGRWVTFGIPGEGGGDLLGWKIITVTEAMLGQRIAQFVSLEIKRATGRLTVPQQRWLDLCAASGAISGVARSVDEARSILGLAQ